MRTSVEVLFVIIITVFTDCISALKVDKVSPVTEGVEAENTGSSDQAPPKSKASKKKVFINELHFFGLQVISPTCAVSEICQYNYIGVKFTSNPL